uniref:Uncharacterized protein n=1 Tax=Arundo donax TaxID=35708 RepID=A0A0A9BZ00_ARUDO
MMDNYFPMASRQLSASSPSRISLIRASMDCSEFQTILWFRCVHNLQLPYDQNSYSPQHFILLAQSALIHSMKSVDP